MVLLLINFTFSMQSAVNLLKLFFLSACQNLIVAKYSCGACSTNYHCLYFVLCTPVTARTVGLREEGLLDET